MHAKYMAMLVHYIIYQTQNRSKKTVDKYVPYLWHIK